MINNSEARTESRHARGKFRAFITRYQHHVSVFAFLVGFIIDNLALPPVDHVATVVILGFYLLFAVLGIVLIQVGEWRVFRFEMLTRLMLFLPPAIQFIFGGLFSSMFVFYARSASLTGSGIFMLLLVVMIIGNEVFRDRYARLEFQVGVLFVTFFGLMIFYIPILFNRLDDIMFLLSGGVSLLAIFLFCGCLFVIAPRAIRGSARTLFPLIGGIYLFVNLLYFTNSIPPIPLALKSAGVYHAISRDAAGEYVGEDEVRSWKERTFARAPLYHYRANESIYFYSAVFAPTALNTPIYHEWQYFDTQRGEWVESTRVEFPIFGGRSRGYRGYSSKNAITPGLWRVVVKTARGQLLGKSTFTVVFVDTPVSLTTKVL